MKLKLFLTTDCNLNCKYCYEMEYRVKQKSQKFNQSILSAILDIVKKRMHAMDDMALHVDFYGGEPLLEITQIYKTVNSIKETLNDKKLSYGITTNGTLINNEILMFLNKNQFSVSISCDGDSKQNSYRVYSDKRPAADSIIDGLKRTITHNSRTNINVNMVVRSDNYDRVIDCIDYLAGFACKKFSLAFDYGDLGWESIPDETLKKYYRDLKMYAVEHYPNYKINIFEDAVIPLDRCYLTETIAINTDGYVYPCIYFPTTTHGKEYALGHVTDGYENIDWGKIDEISKTVTCEKKECKSKNGNCKIGCYGRNLDLMGNLYLPSPIYCKHLACSYGEIFSYRMKIIRKSGILQK